MVKSSGEKPPPQKHHIFAQRDGMCSERVDYVTKDDVFIVYHQSHNAETP